VITLRRAKARQRAGGGEGGKKAGRGRPNRVGPTSGQPIDDSAGRVNRQLAGRLKVGHGTVAQARKVVSHPALAQQVREGETSLNDAYKQARQPFGAERGIPSLTGGPSLALAEIAS
jgi:hypothetical protein